jgi:hypothetical protein
MNKISPVYPTFGTLAAIANGATQSSAVDLTNFVLCGMFIPSAFTGTTITFQCSDAAGGTYVNIADGAGNVLTKTVAVSQYIYLDPNIFAGVRFLKITSGSAEGGARSVELVVRAIT